MLEINLKVRIFLRIEIIFMSDISTKFLKRRMEIKFVDHIVQVV